jgi:hypothetical protein
LQSSFVRKNDTFPAHPVSHLLTLPKDRIMLAMREWGSEDGHDGCLVGTNQGPVFIGQFLSRVIHLEPVSTNNDAATQAVKCI